MKFLIFQNPYELFLILISTQILVYDIESCDKYISKTRNVTFSFKNFQIFFQNRKKIEIIQMDSKKLINLFEIN